MEPRVRFPLTGEQRALVDRARRLADGDIRARAQRWDEGEEYPWDNVELLVREGLMGMTIPRRYGGQERPLLDVLLVIEAVARTCGVTGRILVDSNLGPVGILVHYGSEEQKARFLPRVVAGDKPAIAITEPAAGSAASDLTTTARRDGGDLVLDGTKCWITGAGVSRTYVVFCRMDGIAGAAGVGAVVVDAETPGLKVTRRERAMGMRGIPESEVVFEACRVPVENLIVGPGGFKQLMAAYNGQRLGASTVALGLAQGAFELAVAYAGEREQFGRTLDSFQGLRWMVADMAMEIELARQLIYRTGANAEDGLPDATETAMCKVLASEMAARVTNQALQIHGARGYSRDLPLERMVRDARMFTIAGGTVQVLRNIVADAVLGRRSQRD